MFTAVIVIVSMGSFVVTVQTKVSAPQPQYGTLVDASRSFLAVKCIPGCSLHVHDADGDIDRSFRDFASWDTVLPLSTLPLSWPCSFGRFTFEHRFLLLLGLGVYGVGGFWFRGTSSDNLSV